MNMGLTLAARNLRRHRRRTVLAGAALALAVALLVTALALVEGLFAQMARDASRRAGGDVLVTGGDGGPFQTGGDLVRSLAGHPGVTGVIASLSADAWYTLGDRRVPGRIVGSASIVGSSSVVRDSFPAPSGSTGIVLDTTLAGLLHGSEGMEVTVTALAADGTIAALVIPVLDVGGPAIMRGIGAVGRTGLDQVGALLGIPGQASELSLELHDPARAPAVATELAGTLSPAGLQSSPWQQRLPALAEAARFARASSWWLVALVYAAAGLVLLNILVINHHERRREHALLIALGMPPRLLGRVLLIETVLLGSISIAAGLAGGSAASLLIGSGGIDLSRWVGPVGYAGGTIRPVLGTVLRAADLARAGAAMLAVCALAGWLPARGLDRLRPAGVLSGRAGS